MPTAPAPAVSVLMPVYNGGRFLAAAVDSVLRQTMRDIELIAIDDGSQDASAAVLAEFAARDDRVRVFTQENQGIVAALNRALALARAPLVARMDADDIARPDRLDRQCTFLREHPDILAVSGGMDVIGEDGVYIETILFPTLPVTIADELPHRSVVAHPAVMMRAGSVRDVGGYRQVARYAEDYDLWLRLNEAGPIANLADVVLSYRRHASSTSSVRLIEQQLAAVAVRAAARQRRMGRPDPLAAAERATRVAPLTYAGLRSLLQVERIPKDLAFAFFRETLSRAGQMNAIGPWLRLYARHGLWEIDRKGSRVIMLVGARLLLRQYRKGAGAFGLLPYACLLAMAACRHPITALRDLRQLKQWRLLAQHGLLHPTTDIDSD